MSRMSRYESLSGSYSICTTSACPVVCSHTWRYVGFLTGPPAYPEIAEETPCMSLKMASMHQKQPPPRVAISLCCPFPELFMMLPFRVWASPQYGLSGAAYVEGRHRYKSA